MKSRLEAKHDNSIILNSGIVAPTHKTHFLDNSEASKLLTSINAGHVIDLAWKRGL